VQLMRFGFSLVLALALGAGFASPAAAQSVTTSDVQRLQDSIYDASRAVGQLRSRDASAAGQLQSELDDASDEAVYLKVKLRKNEPIARREFAAVRDRVESIANRARGGDSQPGIVSGAIDDRPVSTVPYPERPSYPNDREYHGENTVRSVNPNEIPVGTEFDVRLQNPLSSKTSQVEDRFEATTMVDLRDERGHVMVPAGSVMRGVVSSVNRATRIER
jgi:TolA-binding protein